MTDIEELRKAAEKATPGPWGDGIHHAVTQGGRTYAYVHAVGALAPVACVPIGVEGYGREEGEANARLIAGCNPATILSLIGEIDRLRAANSKLHRRAQIAEAFMQAAEAIPDGWLRILKNRPEIQGIIVREIVHEIAKAKDRAARRALTGEGTNG